MTGTLASITAQVQGNPVVYKAGGRGADWIFADRGAPKFIPMTTNIWATRQQPPSNV